MTELHHMPQEQYCKLQRIAKQMGIVKVRFKQRTEFPEPDLSSPQSTEIPLSAFSAATA